MDASPAAAATPRLERLVRYLQEDPANPALLADVFDAALAGGDIARAQACVDSAAAHRLDAFHWTLRQARLCIVRRELDQAAALLLQLPEGAGHPVVVHDLAYVRLLQGDSGACRALLQPLLADAPAGVREAMHVLWLRAMHRLRLLDEAWEWAARQQAAGTLCAAAQGVAGLVAIDRSDFAAARGLSEAALAHDPQQVEALVARASVAIALQDSRGAAQLLQRALERNPRDGRTWSALGFASLQARDFPLARQQLERAVALMPDHVGTWHALGWTRLLQADRAGALSAFEQALALDRNFAESHGAVGLLLAMAGDAAAGHHLDVADRLDRANVTGRYARALLAGAASDAAGVEALARQLLDRPGFFGGRLGDAVGR